MLRPVIPWAVACLFTPLSGGQMSDVRSAWSYISGNLIAAAVKLPESDYSFRPTPDVRSFAQLVGHVADAQSAFCAPLLPQAKPRSGAEKLTGKADILDALKESVALCTAAADRVSDAQAAEHVKMFGQDRARLTVFWANIAHSNEHYGNVATYLRLKGVVPPSSEGALRSRVYFDQAHGQFGPQPEMAEIGARTGYQVVVQEQPITAEGLKNFRVLYLRAPSKAISPSEKDAIVGFVKGGGSLLLVVDEEQRQQLAVTGANDLIEPFGMKLTPDTPYLHNCGALAKAGEINAADREIPYSGGRAVEGGTPFAYQLDRDGKPAQAFAAWKKVDSGGRIIVLAEGMASIFLGKKEGQRLTGPPRDAMNTVYWGKDSVIFMEEVLAWLVKR
ncbi:MAG TPA: DinB family protein [Bryobacteraceae bacterium]|nr:DinB family protein [Bryobacteraceae bacterium]